MPHYNVIVTFLGILGNPNKCVVFCRGCESICPQNAISHPDEKETQKIIDKLHNNQKDGHD